MNQHGRLAAEHWARWLPARYAQIPDPDKFFSALGEEVEDQIEELASGLAGDDPPGETYLQKVGRLTEARQTAASTVLRLQVLLDPELGVNPDDLLD